MYEVWDTHTKTRLSTHKTRQTAQRKADRLDNVYGAARYIVKREG